VAEKPAAKARDGRQEVSIGERTVTLSSLDKVLWPKAGFTKAQVIDYYARIAPVLIPHLADRPLTRVRCPDGIDGQRFYEKRAPKGTPEWVRTEPVGMDKAGVIDFIVCDEPATLVWLAQMAALELHPSLARAQDFDAPTVVAFDLDPGPPAGMRECCMVALRVRELFEKTGLDCFPKSSGSKGIQVYVPLNKGVTYERVKPFAQAVARALEQAEPSLVVSRMTKSLRMGKVLVDWSQNTRSKTTVAVYSLRARERPTASAPIEWEEVERGAGGEGDLIFTSAEVLERVEKLGDLFAPVLELEQDLPDGND
jgi:bifunctional non-homologous end joining protein LigD